MCGFCVQEIKELFKNQFGLTVKSVQPFSKNITVGQTLDGDDFMDYTPNVVYLLNVAVQRLPPELAGRLDIQLLFYNPNISLVPLSSVMASFYTGSLGFYFENIIVDRSVVSYAGAGEGGAIMGSISMSGAKIILH